MFIIDNHNKIILTRGDSASINVKVVDLDGNERTLLDTDVITMTVKKTPGSTTLISKTATGGVLVLLPSDTSSLDTGLYVYDVQLATANGGVYTIVPLSFLDLMEEVS